MWLSVGVCVCVRAKKDITGIKEHEAKRPSKSRAGWMIMALTCSLYIAHNTLMLAELCRRNTEATETTTHLSCNRLIAGTEK